MQDSNIKEKSLSSAEEIKTTPEKEIAENTSSPVSEKKSISKTWRWLEIIGFILLYIAALNILAYITDPVRLNNPEIMISRERNVVDPLNEPEDSLDVIIAGDSEAWAMVNPAIMMDEAGISAYNCNQLGQGVIETYYFLEKLFDKQHPQVVILETNVITHDTTFNTDIHLGFNAMVNETFPFLKYHSNWKYLVGLADAAEYTAVRGYDDLVTVDPYSGEEYMFETDKTYKVNPFTIYYLNKVNEICKENGATLVLASSPSPVNMNYEKHNALQAYADSHDIDFIDFNLLIDEIGIDWANDTGDAGDHINMYGTPKTTGYLIDYLEENYDLPDHRED